MTWSCGTRSTKRKGPLQTGARAKSLPAASVALGGRIMPARSVSCERKAPEGCLRVIFTVAGSTTSMWSIALSSLRRKLPGIVRCRSSEYLTAAASSVSPFWKVTPGRILRTSVLSSAHS